jgi:hypothetical protein
VATDPAHDCLESTGLSLIFFRQPRIQAQGSTAPTAGLQ